MELKDIPQDVVARAKQIFKDRLDDFPEDSWITVVRGEWELNLFKPNGKEYIATLYPVINNIIDTQNFVRLIHWTDTDYTLFQKALDIQMELEWSVSREQIDDTIEGIAPLKGGGCMIMRKGGF